VGKWLAESFWGAKEKDSLEKKIRQVPILALPNLRQQF